ncbi:hypothetical protein LINPERPRIM_LOCUS39032 [Linum perenne]
MNTVPSSSTVGAAAAARRINKARRIKKTTPVSVDYVIFNPAQCIQMLMVGEGEESEKVGSCGGEEKDWEV